MYIQQIEEVEGVSSINNKDLKKKMCVFVRYDKREKGVSIIRFRRVCLSVNIWIMKNVSATFHMKI